MENLVSLTKYLVKQVIDDENSFSVKLLDNDDESILIEVLVSSSLIGKIIGKNGKMALSIRNIVQAAAYNNNIKKVKINFDAF